MTVDELKYPGSRRIYVPGALFPDIKVAMREVTLSDSVFPDGTTESNDPVRIYDCSGPWGDAEFHGQAEQGLPRMREEWILSRGDVCRDAGGALQATDLKQAPTQREYARRGIITPEMEYVAIRENLGREAAFKAIYDQFPSAKSRPEQAQQLLDSSHFYWHLYLEELFGGDPIERSPRTTTRVTIRLKRRIIDQLIESRKIPPIQKRK